MGPRHECGVAEQRDAVEDHPGRLHVVDRLHHVPLGAHDHLGELRRQQRESVLFEALDVDRADQRRRDRVFVRVAGCISEDVGQLVAGGDGVVPQEAVAPARPLHGVVGAGHGIADELAPEREAEGELVEGVRAELGGEVALLHDAAPGDVAGVARAHLGRAERTHGGAEAIRADDEVGLDAGAVREAGDDLVAAMLEADELAAEVIALAGECRMQRVEDAAPGAEVLGIVEARDDLAVICRRRCGR